jgi:hypothetical protein
VNEAAVDRKVKVLELILEHSAKWRPVDSDEVADMRKTMSRIDESAIFDFVRMMEKCKACERAPWRSCSRRVSCGFAPPTSTARF